MSDNGSGTNRARVLIEETEKLVQPDLVTVFCATLAKLDDEHLVRALKQIDDNDLGTLVGTGIVEQRERERASGFYGFCS